MDNAIVVNKTAHGIDTGLLFEVDANNVQGFGIAIGLGIVALACILAKCLFLYYIRVHAPKERPMNRLMALEQVRIFFCILFQFLVIFVMFQAITLIMQVPLFTMVIGVIAFSTTQSTVEF